MIAAWGNGLSDMVKYLRGLEHSVESNHNTSIVKNQNQL